MQTKNIKNYNQISKEMGDILTPIVWDDNYQDNLNIVHDEILDFIKDLNSSSEAQRAALSDALKIFLAPHSRLNIMKLAYLMDDQRLAQYLIEMHLLPRPMYQRVFTEQENAESYNKLIDQHYQLSLNATRRQFNISKLAFLWFIKGIRQNNSTINFLFYIPEIVNLIGEYVESNVFFASTNLAVKCRNYLDNWKGIEEKDHQFYLLPSSEETTSTSDEMDDEALIKEFELSFNMFKAPVFDPEKTMVELIKNLDIYLDLKRNDKDWAFYSACTLKNTFNNPNNYMDFKMFIIDTYINKNTDQLFANYKGSKLLNALQRSCRGFEVSIAQGAKRYAEANSLDMLAVQLEILKLLKFQPPLAGLTEDVVKPINGHQEKCCIQ